MVVNWSSTTEMLTGLGLVANALVKLVIAFALPTGLELLLDVSTETIHSLQERIQKGI
jgi:hypothetical protein